MLRNIDEFYLEQEEPVKGCLMALRTIILAHEAKLEETWKYSMPFFYYKGKMFCYMRIDKKTGCPYISFAAGNKITHEALVQGNRKRFKVLMIDPEDDIPLETIREIFEKAIETYP